MSGNAFFPAGHGKTIGELIELTGASAGARCEPDLRITGVATLSEAGPDDIAYFDNPRYAHELATTRAGCVMIPPRREEALPASLCRIVAKDAAGAFAQIGRVLFPSALRPQSTTGAAGLSAKAEIDPSAYFEDGVTVEAFCVIGPDVTIGAGTIVGAGAVIGKGCKIGRDARIGAGVTVTHSYCGDRVILHPGVRIGQDGFGYTAGPKGLMKSVQIGRVIIQDDVEIGANTTIDRGGTRDTVIGEGTKIDNAVQIGHNVVVGRHCVIVSQVGISGSAVIGDGVMIGGQSGVNGHVTIGDGAQIAAVSSVTGNVPAGVRWGGMPAKPVREWFRELTLLSELAKKQRVRKRDE